MSASVERPDDKLWILRVRGTMLKSDLESLQARYARSVKPGEETTLLVILEDFAGWEKGAAWDDLEFFFTHGDSIVKIAIVGEPMWEVQAMAFAGAGMRTAGVRFFPPSAEGEARAWLG